MSLSRSLWRGLAVASVAGLVTLSASLAPAHAQVSHGGYTITQVRPMAGVPTTYIVPVKTSEIYYPSYLAGCVHTASPAFDVKNTTTASQQIVSFPSFTPIGSPVPAGSTVGFNVSGTFPGYILIGVASNHPTGAIVYCT